MEPLYKSLKESIKKGEYFSDARHWYKYKYIHPFTQRSFIFLLGVIACALVISISININSLFPSVIKIKYSINTTTSANKSSQIARADKFKNDSQKSIADIMVRNYVTNREKFNYYDLKKQFIFVKNNSTRIVFRRFSNFVNITNPLSPVLKYKEHITRKIKIIDTEYLNQSKAIVKFNSIAQNAVGEISENIVWQATINFEIDKINLDRPAGSRFNFTVTDYHLNLLKDKGEK